MKRRTAQEIEYHYFEQFRTHYQLPAGIVDYEDKPDVRILGERKVGIEIARLYLTDGSDPSAEQVQAGRRNEVLALAQEMHQEAGGRLIELHVDFDPSQPILDIREKARQVAALATSIQDRKTTHVGQRAASAQGLRFVYHNGIEYPDARWRTAQVFTVPNLKAERITELVLSKAVKAKRYEHCDSLWLLLVVDLMDPAQDQELTLPSDYRLPNSPFERVIVYKPQLGQVLEIPH